MSVNTGWPHSEIDKLTLRDVEALKRQWETTPPMIVSLAVLSGLYKEQPKPSTESEFDDFFGSLRSVGNGK